jgi:hypothetical protein
MLPPEVRKELEHRIVERAFSGYEELAEWLQAQGYHIAHDSIQRYGWRLRQKIDMMERLAEDAKAIAAATAHAGESIVDATIQLIHQRVFSMLLDPEHRKGSSSAGVPACAPYAEGLGADRKESSGAGVPACSPHLEEEDGAREGTGCADAGAGALHSNGRSASLEIRDLARLTRIVADVNRVTIARQRRAEESRSRLAQQEHAAGERLSDTEGGLSEEAYHAIRNALLGIDPFDPKHREGSRDAGVPACAPQVEGQGGDHQGIRLHPLPHPSQEIVERTRTGLDEDRRTSTQQLCSNEPLIDTSDQPGCEPTIKCT